MDTRDRQNIQNKRPGTITPQRRREEPQKREATRPARPQQRVRYDGNQARNGKSRRRKKRSRLPVIVGAALITVIVVIFVIIGVSSKEPDCFDLNKSSITMHGDAEGVLIKDEAGYTYPEGCTIVSRVPDGTYVNIGDVIAVVRTEGFDVDWYTNLDIARRATIEYVMGEIGSNELLVNSLNELDKRIAALKDEMLSVLSFYPEKYSDYSNEIEKLYVAKRDMAVSGLPNDINVDYYVRREELVIDRMKAYTQEIKALKSGYISYNADGYANLYNYDTIDTVTETVYNNIRENKFTTSIKNIRKNNDYFISDLSKCYVALKGMSGTFKYLSVNDETIIRLNDGQLQHMAIVKTVSESVGGVYAVIEPAGTFPELYREREVFVRVQKTWTGLVVPKEHIVKKKDRTGVYIYQDKKKIFVPITVLAENDTVVILDTSTVDNIFVEGMKIVKQ